MPSWAQVRKDIRHLVADDVEQAWKWASVRLGALIFLAPTLYENVDVVQDYLPRNVFAMLQAGLGILVMVNAMRKKAK